MNGEKKLIDIEIQKVHEINISSLLHYDIKEM